VYTKNLTAISVTVLWSKICGAGCLKTAIFITVR